MSYCIFQVTITVFQMAVMLDVYCYKNTLINLFINCLLRTYYVLDPVLGIWNLAGNKSDKHLALMGRFPKKVLLNSSIWLRNQDVFRLRQHAFWNGDYIMKYICINNLKRTNSLFSHKWELENQCPTSEKGLK